MNELLQRIVGHIRTTRGELRRAADGAGIPLGTLTKIAYGQTTNPRIDTVEKLATWFERERGA